SARKCSQARAGALDSPGEPGRPTHGNFEILQEPFAVPKAPCREIVKICVNLAAPATGFAAVLPWIAKFVGHDAREFAERNAWCGRVDGVFHSVRCRRHAGPTLSKLAGKLSPAARPGGKSRARLSACSAPGDRQSVSYG